MTPSVTNAAPRVAFGGIFLDAVLSSRKHKIFRSGSTGYLGRRRRAPLPQGSLLLLNLLWRVYSKKVKGLPHQTKSQLARQMLDLVATWLPAADRVCGSRQPPTWQVPPQGLATERPCHRPHPPKASLTRPLPDGDNGKRKKGTPLPNPTQLLSDPTYQARTWCCRCPTVRRKKLQVKVTRRCAGICVTATRDPLVLVHDPAGKWRDELLLSTDGKLAAKEVILGYMRRWERGSLLLGIEKTSGAARGAGVDRVGRAEDAPDGVVRGWSGVGVVCEVRAAQEQARWERPWYKQKVGPTFADMLADASAFVATRLAESAPDERNDVLGLALSTTFPPRWVASTRSAFRPPATTTSTDSNTEKGTILRCFRAALLTFNYINSSYIRAKH